MNMILSHWSASPVVLAVLAVVAAAHLSGMRIALAGPNPRRRAALMQAAAFYCGLAAVVIALLSPVAHSAQTYIWVRSMQDVLLAIVAPGLIVLGAPWSALRHGAAALGSRARALDPGIRAQAGPAPAVRSPMTWPAIVTVAFNVCWIGWHLPGPYDAALRHPAVFAAEAVSYLGLGIAFWLQLIGSGSLSPRLAPLPRVTLVTATATCSAVMAMVLMFGTGRIYPAYAGITHRVLGVVGDQNLAGAVLLALSLPPFVIAAIALCIRWLAAEESGAPDTEFDSLLRPSASGWPSWPGYRSVK
jgi:cytochrome c oxidase assembly factor CtaG